jgi:uncharacterized protein (TIGR03437 family)
MRLSGMIWVIGGLLGTAVSGWADVSGSVVVRSNFSLSLENGQVEAVGAKGSATGVPDVAFINGSLAPQGKATAAIYPSLTGEGTFDNLTETTLAPLKFLASAAPLALSRLPVGTVLAVFTNGGHTAKVLVVASSTAELTLKYLTYISGSTGAGSGPTITGVFNNSSHIPDGLPNSGIAPSSIFIITGTNLADAGAPVLQSSAPPGLPLTLNGASIAVSSGGVTTSPAIYYTSPTQIAAVLPASTRVGAATITVTHNGTASATFPINVVQSALGINTYNGFGVATDAVTGALITYNNSAAPGQTLVLWTTGLGADPLDSDTTFSSSPHSVGAPLHVYIGGVEATILYQGSAGYPGVNQINLVIPSSAPEGCYVGLAAVVGTALNHAVILPIRRGGGACVDLLSGLTGDQISPTAGTTLRGGVVELVTSTTTNARGERTSDSGATAAFATYRGLYPTNNLVSPGGCIIYDFTPGPIPSVTILDPGVVTLSGPNGLSMTLNSLAGVRTAQLPATAIPAAGGTFTFRGAGSAAIGAFTATVDLVPFTWTNPESAATVIKSQGLTVNWTGGKPGTYVYISGTSTVANRGSGPLLSGYKCMAAVEAHQFTVPAYILSALLDGLGSTAVQNTFFNPFSVSGVDVATAGGAISYSVPSTFRATPAAR